MSSKRYQAIFMALLMCTSYLISPGVSSAEAESSGRSLRHIYAFADGDGQNIANYGGGSPDVSTVVSIPKGAKVTDVEMKLAGASATGWSDVEASDVEDWMGGEYTSIDVRSEDLTLGMLNPELSFESFGLDTYTDDQSTAMYDNGSFALRQPHTSNATETRFSKQVELQSNVLMSRSQGAIVKHHDYLFMSTWMGSQFQTMVKRMFVDNASLDTTIHLDQGNCVLPQDPSSSYYKGYAFRDWALTDDERLFGIFTTYKYFYSNAAPAEYHRVLEFDVRDDDVWHCLHSYDISPQFGDYTALSYDRTRDKVWVVHNSQHKVVTYEFDNGQFTRGDLIYTFNTAGTSNQCGTSNGITRGLAVHGDMFFMRCLKDNYYNNRDQLKAWAITGSSTSLIPQTSSITISSMGTGLVYDGERLITVDSGYSSSSNSLRYREFGSGITYDTIPAPGSTTWYGDVTYTDSDIVAVNVESYWSAVSQGDRVDYWISADNGTHWELVTSNETIHFDYPGSELIWKIQLIGSSAVSWWFEIEYATEYASSGTWYAPILQVGTSIGKVRPEWDFNLPTGTNIQLRVTNDEGVNWYDALNGQELSFPSDTASTDIQYAITFSTDNSILTPRIQKVVFWYEEGYPDKPELDVGNDGTFDWQSIQFLNESSVIASDASNVGSEVAAVPTLVEAFNTYIPQNGEGNVDIPIAVKAASPGRVKIYDLDITYEMETRAVSVEVEGGVLVPDGIWRDLSVYVALGDGVGTVTEVTAGLAFENLPSTAFRWETGNQCTSVNTEQTFVFYDSGNCTLTTTPTGLKKITIPVKSNWTLQDNPSSEAIISVVDNEGLKVSDWISDNFGLRIENDLQLSDLSFFDFNGQSLQDYAWVRGGTNLSISGTFAFEGTSYLPLPGEFDIVVSGQNVTFDGDPDGPAIELFRIGNPAFGDFEILVQTPMESSPGGMLVTVAADMLPSGSVHMNRDFSNRLLIFDGNSPLVVSATPNGGERRASPSQAISVVIQDSVDPPIQITLNYWLGCQVGEFSQCSDTNFNGLPEENEYIQVPMTNPETLSGGINVFQGSIDDSVLTHRQKVTFYVTGQDGKGNEIANGGLPVCPTGPPYCGYFSGEIEPRWNQTLATYTIREEFKPVLNVEESTIIGHDDSQPLHPGLDYTIFLNMSDENGWKDLDSVHISLGEDLEDRSTTIYGNITMNADEEPLLILTSESTGLAVSNLYSTLTPDPFFDTHIYAEIKFQLTWYFPEVWDTDGEELFVPLVKLMDKPCNFGEVVACNQPEFGLGNDKWSLDNDFRFDMSSGQVRAVELRNGINHFLGDGSESIIGVGQAVRFSGRVMFSEDETPAPSGSMDVVIGDFENEWRVASGQLGKFDIDFLVPSIRSGHLVLTAKLEGLPGLATYDQADKPVLRFAVDDESPSIGEVILSGYAPNQAIPISSLSSLEVSLDARDNYGFNINQPPIFHYVVRAGNAEIARNSVPLDDVEIFGSGADDIIWSSSIDLLDSGATSILPSYTMDAWITGTDASGNSFSPIENNIDNPSASWNFALSGPNVSLRHTTTALEWSNPSPSPQESVSLLISISNNGNSGEVGFVLQHLSESGEWNLAAEGNTTIKSGDSAKVSLDVLANGEPGDYLQYRLLLIESGVEKDRMSLPPLLIKESVIRDGAALGTQISEYSFAVVMFVITLLAMSFGVYQMVIIRRIRRGEDVSQTEEVEAEYEKSVPDLAAAAVMESDLYPPLPVGNPNPVMPQPTSQMPPLPNGQLPPGWTMEQWQHYGQQYLDSLR